MKLSREIEIELYVPKQNFEEKKPDTYSCKICDQELRRASIKRHMRSFHSEIAHERWDKNVTDKSPNVPKLIDQQRLVKKLILGQIETEEYQLRLVKLFKNGQSKKEWFPLIDLLGSDIGKKFVFESDNFGLRILELAEKMETVQQKYPYSCQHHRCPLCLSYKPISHFKTFLHNHNHNSDSIHLYCIECSKNMAEEVPTRRDAGLFYWVDRIPPIAGVPTFKCPECRDYGTLARIVFDF